MYTVRAQVLNQLDHVRLFACQYPPIAYRLFLSPPGCLVWDCSSEEGEGATGRKRPAPDSEEARVEKISEPVKTIILSLSRKSLGTCQNNSIKFFRARKKVASKPDILFLRKCGSKKEEAATRSKPDGFVKWVREWDVARRPKPSRTNSSFPRCGEIIGGVVEFTGYGCTLETSGHTERC